MSDKTQKADGVISTSSDELGFIVKFKNAITVVKQIKNDEWIPRFNPFLNKHAVALRNGRELWLSNGSWFCDVDHLNAFGYLMRHYVWWMAARKLKKKADLAVLKNPLLKLYEE